MKSALVSVLFSLLAVVASISATDKRKPNFVLLFVDDLGYGDLGFTGHPTTQTPTFDSLAAHGKILSTWYSGCNVCTGSRAALMSGRQFLRQGLPGVIGPDCPYGLNLNETTIAEHLKTAGSATCAVGKWHLGQRLKYLPGNRGFDYYLGIPFSDDMGIAWESSCPVETEDAGTIHNRETFDPTMDHVQAWSAPGSYEEMAFLDAMGVPQQEQINDKGTKWLPLVHQKFNKTEILEQPVDFTTLAQK